MSTYHEYFYCGLKKPRSVRVDVTVEITGSINSVSGAVYYSSVATSDFDPRLFEAEMQGIVAKILEERKK